MLRTITFLSILLALTGAARAQEIGRLFSTPAERAALERGRHAKKLPGAPAAAASEAAPPQMAMAAGEQFMVVNGTVRRSGTGRETTWIDSVAHSGNDRLPAGATLSRGTTAGKVELTLRSGQRISVKPGQQVDAVSGQVRESYQRAPAPKLPVVPSE
jgi:hypothetical protein